jgi:hypothetical protein
MDLRIKGKVKETLRNIDKKRDSDGDITAISTERQYQYNSDRNSDREAVAV